MLKALQGEYGQQIRSLQCKVPGMSTNAIFSCKSTVSITQNKEKQPLFIYVFGQADCKAIILCQATFSLNRYKKASMT